MKILAIETSCDETAIAVVEATGDDSSAHFSILGNILVSQIDLHRQYGGVFPTLAKREHTKNIIPILRASLEEAEMLHEIRQDISESTRSYINTLFSREEGLSQSFLEFITEIDVPEIDAIAVTAGPGLEPALWVGINTARALASIWDKPLVAVNHMEGHIMTALTQEDNSTSISPDSKMKLAISDVATPVLALLISGGHTELLAMNEWLSYELIGTTRDDAVGEAFDKVARLLGLPYPGGPEISRLAEIARKEYSESTYTLPRPMKNDGTNDFSFSGLKTATRYLIQSLGEIDDATQKAIALEFENASTDVLLSKTLHALKDTHARTITIGGGVSANEHIRKTFTETITDKYPDITLRIPDVNLTTDNAIMIALSGFYHALRKEYVDPKTLRADGNAELSMK